MTRSTIFSVLAVLSLLVQATVVSAAIEPGTYMIRSEDGGLAIGPVPLIWPPPDVPARVMNFMVERWNVAKNEDGFFTITELRGGYKVVQRRENDIFVSQKTELALPLAIEPVGNNQYTISVANKDRFFTYQPEDPPPIVLQPDHGAESQKWTFVRADREL
ncbi:hypothetical protein BGW39_009867 [Mortierella sp. 14UC]|nr:hypothetical protein BGW39_009867 [Mortierella sp. 14UC]